MINCYFDGAYTSVTSHPAYLHDYGQILRVFDLDLPVVVEAHFSLEESGESILRMGTCEKGITHIPIPDSCLEETGSFYCYIFDRDSTSGKTVYKIKIPVLKRADMPTETTEPSEQDVSYFEQVLAQMTELAERAEAAAEGGAGGAQPYIVEIERRGSGDTSTYTCKQTFAEITEAIASGKYVLAKEERYSEQEGGDPWATNYLQLTGVGSSQLRFGGNNVVYMPGRDVTTGDAWMFISPTYTLKSSDALTFTYATMSPATLSELNALASSMTETYKVTFYRTRADGDSYIVTCDRTLEDITAAFEADKYVFAEVQTSYDNGETFAVTEACLPCIDSGNQNFIFGWNGMYLLHEDNPDQSDSWETHYSCYELRYNYQTQQEEAVWTYGTTCHATLTDLNALTDRISQLEARVAALEGGNG